MRFFGGTIKHVGKTLIVALLAALVLLLDVAAVCPQLHELFHKDAQSTQHQCAVTLFAHGQVDSAAVDVVSTVSLTSVEFSPQFIFATYSPAIENLPAGRGPPVSSSNS